MNGVNKYKTDRNIFFCPKILYCFTSAPVFQNIFFSDLVVICCEMLNWNYNLTFISYNPLLFSLSLVIRSTNMDPSIVLMWIVPKSETLNPTYLPHSGLRYLYLDVLQTLYIKGVLENEVGWEAEDWFLILPLPLIGWMTL